MAMANGNTHTSTDDVPQHYISPSYVTVHIYRSSLHYDDGIKNGKKTTTYLNIN
jgi:hypothetical protein